MALYSAKEAKWYRRNVERREHRQFKFPFLPPPLPLLHQVSRLLVLGCRTFVTVRIAKSIAKFESSNSFLFTPPPLLSDETFPRSTPNRKSGLITSRATRARRREGIKCTSQGCT